LSGFWKAGSLMTAFGIHAARNGKGFIPDEFND
jgi:hypothetical protein